MIKVNDAYEDGYSLTVEQHGPDSFSVCLYLNGMFMGSVTMTAETLTKLGLDIVNLTSPKIEVQ